jgi:hypothetical protein
MINYRFVYDSELSAISVLAQRTYVEAFGHSFQLEDLDVHLTAIL